MISRPCCSRNTRRAFCGALALITAAVISSPTSADAIKCREPGGKIVISSGYCDERSTAVSVQRSDSITAAQQQNAINDLQRQRQYLNNLERERQASAQRVVSNDNHHRGTGDAYDTETRDRIHACLMKITATTGLSSNEIARRKVDCYRNTRTLAGECEGRITATAGLMSNQEQFYRAQCRQVSGS